MRLIAVLLLLAGCSTIATEVPCDNKNRIEHHHPMPFFAVAELCSKATGRPSLGCAVYTDTEAVLIYPPNEPEIRAHEAKHARCGAFHP